MPSIGVVPSSFSESGDGLWGRDDQFSSMYGYRESQAPIWDKQRGGIHVVRRGGPRGRGRRWCGLVIVELESGARVVRRGGGRGRGRRWYRLVIVELESG